MKAYVYSQEDIREAMGQPAYERCKRAVVGLPNTLESTAVADDTAWFFVPLDIGVWERHGGGIEAVVAGLKQLPYWENNGANHFFFMHSDNADPLGVDAVIFRQSCNRDRKDSRTISFPARVDDFEVFAHDNFADLPYSISFVGHVTPRRNNAYQALSRREDVLLNGIPVHWGAYVDTSLGKKRREVFLYALRNAKMGFAPRGGGQHSFRFFEIMSAGRVPVLMADTYERPFEDLIPYDDFSFKIPESNAGQLDIIVGKLLDVFSDETLQQKGWMARFYWDRYLREERWPEMVARYLEMYK